MNVGLLKQHPKESPPLARLLSAAHLLLEIFTDSIRWMKRANVSV